MLYWWFTANHDKYLLYEYRKCKVRLAIWLLSNGKNKLFFFTIDYFPNVCYVRLAKKCVIAHFVGIKVPNLLNLRFSKI